MWDIFISYAREDELEFALPLKLSLKRLGAEIWYDQEALVVGNTLQAKIADGIKNSKYGVVLLSANYFLPQKKDSTLYELDILLEKYKNADYECLIPVRCEFLTADILTEKYFFLNDILYADWANGFQNVIKNIIRIIRPDLYKSISFDESIDLPNPKNQGQASAIIRMYQQEGRYLDGAQVALNYLSKVKNDPNIMKLYLSCVQSTNNRFEVSIATGFVYNWIKQNPHVTDTRDKFLNFLKNKNKPAIKYVINDMSKWLIEEGTINTRTAYLSLVAIEGTDEQVKTAIMEGKKWLDEKDEPLIRMSLLLLICRRSNKSGLINELKQTMLWLKRNPDDVTVRALFLKEIKH